MVEIQFALVVLLRRPNPVALKHLKSGSPRSKGLSPTLRILSSSPSAGPSTYNVACLTPCADAFSFECIKLILAVVACLEDLRIVVGIFEIVGVAKVGCGFGKLGLLVSALAICLIFSTFPRMESLLRSSLPSPLDTS